MKIKSRLKEYEVFVEKSKDFWNNIVQKDNSFYVIDKNVYGLYHDIFSSIDNERLFLLEALEENKTIDTALEICERITAIPAKRNATLISVGGGIVQDVTGFVANVVYRGINWIFIPSTLLAACDSCIGGKTSLNYKKYKNLLGTFYPPSEIHIWNELFNTLSDSDFRSGLGEVVKFNIMSGENGLLAMERFLPNLINREPDVISRFIQSSLEYKKSFIEVDEFDHGERVKLNFAHTFGHAIEVVSGYGIPHGTAVAIGMIMANSLSYKRGYVDQKFIKRSELLLLQIIDIRLELLSDCSFADFLSAVKKDKKQVGASITAVLISSYGENCVLSIEHDVTEKEIEYAIDYFVRLYGEEK